jgi:hypothetical protein
VRLLGHLKLADYRKAKTPAPQPPKRREQYQNDDPVARIKSWSREKNKKTEQAVTFETMPPTGLKRIARG